MIPEDEYVRLVCTLNLELRGIQAMLVRPYPNLLAALHRLENARKVGARLRSDIVEEGLL
jgi:hypothetical protein